MKKGKKWRKGRKRGKGIKDERKRERKGKKRKTYLNCTNRITNKHPFIRDHQGTPFNESILNVIFKYSSRKFGRKEIFFI